MTEDDKGIKNFKFKIKFKTHVNLVWGQPIPGDKRKREAIAYQKGFPATFYMTDRRVFVTGAFVEKKGLGRKSTNNLIYFEAGLQYIKEHRLDIYKKVRSGYISFKPHGMLKEGIIHFIRLEPNIIKGMLEVIENIPNLKRLRENTGIVELGGNPRNKLNKRLKK